MSDTRAIMEVTEGTEEDRKFEGALNSILHMDKKDYPAYVGGLKIASGHEFPVASPVDNSIIFGTFQEPEEGLTDRAVIVAKEAFSKWSAVDPADRMEIFDKALDNIIRQKYRIAALVTLSSGMTRDEALDEVERLIEVIDDGCQDLDEGINGSPAGVWAILSEYNSPLAAPMGYAAAAMMAGNTVVIIPSKYTPAPIFFVYEMFVKAGLPDGVLNIITDRFDSTTNSLANNMDVSGIVAIGSGDRLENLMFLQADEDLRFINEIKGMNPILVYKPGNMKDAARKVATSAFSFAGQSVDACSKVVVTIKEQKQFLDELLAVLREFKIDDPAEPGTDMGPIISKAMYDRFDGIIDDNFDYLVYGGKRVMNELTGAGYYATPAVFVGAPEDEDINNMDNSVPILSVQIVEDLDAAIDVINCSEYGLSAGVITKDDAVADQFIREVNADEIFVNDPSIIIGAASKAKVANFLD